MTDLEMTKACAEAMGIAVSLHKVEPFATEPVISFWVYPGIDQDGECEIEYSPIHNDAQAMALIKKFGLATWGSDYAAQEWKWHAEVQVDPADKGYAIGHGDNLNRAICECVAKLKERP